MQITSISSPKNVPWMALVTGIGCGLAIILFCVILNRMGLLPGLLTPEKPVPPAGAVHLISKDMRFRTDTLRLKVGDTVTLQLENNDLYAHSFDIDEMGVHAAMPANSSNNISFIPTQEGKFSFYCGVPGHEAAGMVGTIIVEK